MQDPTVHSSLGLALDHCFSAAVAAWLNAYGSRGRKTDSFAAEVAAVEMTSSTFSGGYTSLAVAIKARRRFNDETYVFRINRRGWKEYVVTDSSLT